MAEKTGIAWCDSTFNPWIGCTKVSAGCANCYAERDFDHRYGKAKWGPAGMRVFTSRDNWRKPGVWNRDAAGRTHRVFCASLADVFEDWDGPMLSHKGGVLRYCVSCAKLSDSGSLSSECCRASMMPMTMDDARRQLFDLIDATPNLTWLLLTKRPENVRRMWPTWPNGFAADGSGGHGSGCRFIKNVWLGTSCENQEMTSRRVPTLLGCGDLCSKLFLSCEPLLGPVEFHDTWASNHPYASSDARGIDWVITGDESGPGARPTELAWHESIVRQCRDAGVAVFVKQLVLDGELVKDIKRFPESVRFQLFP